MKKKLVDKFIWKPTTDAPETKRFNSTTRERIRAGKIYQIEIYEVLGL